MNEWNVDREKFNARVWKEKLFVCIHRSFVAVAATVEVPRMSYQSFHVMDAIELLLDQRALIEHELHAEIYRYFF